MRRCEAGGEIVQFVVAVPLLLAVVFGTGQVAGMFLAAEQLSSEVTRACRQVDVGGFDRAADKAAFVKEGILGASTQLRAGSLEVENVRSEAGARHDAGTTSDGAALERRASTVALSYDVSYRMPALAVFPGLTGQVLQRHVACTYTAGTVVEIEVRRA